MSAGETEADLVARAVADGYPDVTENCPHCDAIFRNYHHWVRCDYGKCPMRSKDKRTLLDLMEAAGTPAEPS